MEATTYTVLADDCDQSITAEQAERLDAAGLIEPAEELKGFLNESVFVLTQHEDVDHALDRLTRRGAES